MRGERLEVVVPGRAARCRLAYELSGEGDRHVTLLHGLASTKETWDVIAPALGPRFRVLRIDMRGHGGSSSPEGTWTLGDLGDDVVAALDVLGTRRTALVGHSGGGVVAMNVALRHPDRVSHLVLAATASQANERAAQWYEAMARKAEERGGASVLPDLGWEAGGPAPDGPGFAKAARCMATLFANPMTPELSRIRCPVTIVVGGDDHICAGGSVIMHRNIPGSGLAIVAGRGHAIHREDPSAFVRYIVETLER